jgi:hypothetical protein
VGETTDPLGALRHGGRQCSRLDVYTRRMNVLRVGFWPRSLLRDVVNRVSRALLGVVARDMEFVGAQRF